MDHSPLCFGVVRFATTAAADDKIGQNGLPVTPAATNVIGRFQRLKRVLHPHVCQALDICHGHQDRLVIVSEHYGTSLHTILTQRRSLDLPRLRLWAYQLTSTLAFLHDLGLPHRNLSLRNVCLANLNHVMLANFGLYYATGWGAHTDFPMGAPEALSPEIVLSYPHEIGPVLSMKADIWALGTIIASMATLLLSTDHPDAAFIRDTFASHKDIDSKLRTIVLRHMAATTTTSVPARERREQRRVWGTQVIDDTITAAPRDGTRETTTPVSAAPDELVDVLLPLQAIDHDLYSFVVAAMNMSVIARPSAQELLSHPFMKGMRPACAAKAWHVWPILQSLQEEDMQTDGDVQHHPRDSLLNEAPLPYLYHLWRLLVGPVENVLAEQKAANGTNITTEFSPAILNIPSLVFHSTLDEPVSASSSATLSIAPSEDGTSQNLAKALYLGETASIYLNAQLRSKLRLRSCGPDSDNVGSSHAISSHQAGTSKTRRADPYDLAKVNFLGPEHELPNNLPPLVVRERDFGYQKQRIILFDELLRGYPETLPEIRVAARQDIPPLLRARIWRALLGIEGETKTTYMLIDKNSEGGFDRQIDVDIPRCHQYHVLLASERGHHQLRRLLKSWARVNDKLVYWQGLDSVCAPFLVLNFESEHDAFACLQAFIPRFLNDFFAYDNSHVLQDSLAVFRHLLSFHDAELAAHMDDIGFLPELFAIPWFLTLYTHVFPMGKIFHLFDRILVSPPALSLYIGIAILRQLRSTLLAASFNESIMLFSETPDADIEQCLLQAFSMAKQTPPSIVRRVHDQLSEAIALADTGSSSSAEENWWEKPISLEDKKAELAPRLSLRDFLQLRPLIATIDTRDEDEFSKAHVPHSWNVHVEELDDVEVNLREQPRPYIVIVANKGKSGPAIARRLIYKRFNRVSLLHGGMEALRTAQASRSMSLCTCRPTTIETGLNSKPIAHQSRNYLTLPTDTP